MTITLKVAKREERGKAVKKLRAADRVPGVMYGPKEENISLSIDRPEFERVLKEAGESSVIVLKGLDTQKEVLVHEVEFDPVKGRVAHVDFYAIEAGKELTTNVPLVFVGEAPATKVGGSVSKALFEVEVTCMPKDLPHDIEVDISSLEDISSSLHVSDLTVPNGVKIENDPEDVVASVVETEEEPEEEPEEVDMDSIEVEQKGKEEEEGESTSEGEEGESKE